jgi:hypothetical protein
MNTAARITAVGFTLATLALGCSEEETPGEGSPPVAASDSAITDLDTPVLLHPTANDVADAVCLAAQTVDLDPAASGQQTSYVTAAGTFALAADGDVLFAPAAGFVGEATASYIVADVDGRLSNPADMLVTVRATRMAPSSIDVVPVPIPAARPVPPRLVPVPVPTGAVNQRFPATSNL